MRPHHKHNFSGVAESIQGYIRDKMPEWKARLRGRRRAEARGDGCIVNGPGESKAANIASASPALEKPPRCPVYIDGQHFKTLEGTYDELSAAFQALVDDYVRDKISQARNSAASNVRPDRGRSRRIWRCKTLRCASSRSRFARKIDLASFFFHDLR